jgi:hypothetical protein
MGPKNMLPPPSGSLPTPWCRNRLRQLRKWLESIRREDMALSMNGVVTAGEDKQTL